MATTSGSHVTSDVTRRPAVKRKSLESVIKSLQRPTSTTTVVTSRRQRPRPEVLVRPMRPAAAAASTEAVTSYSGGVHQPPPPGVIDLRRPKPPQPLLATSSPSDVIARGVPRGQAAPPGVDLSYDKRRRVSSTGAWLGGNAVTGPDARTPPRLFPVYYGGNGGGGCEPNGYDAPLELTTYTSRDGRPRDLTDVGRRQV